jgi:hypothetical protein
VKKLFLRAVLAGDELHIIHHQHIDRAEQVFEIHDFAVAQGLHESVHELFGRKIQNLQIGALGFQFPAMACIRWVLPKPTPPYKNSGLKVTGPASATRRAAAWASSFGLPTTKLSNVRKAASALMRATGATFCGQRCSCAERLWLRRGPVRAELRAALHSLWHLVARSDGLFDLAQEGAQARAARFVDSVRRSAGGRAFWTGVYLPWLVSFVSVSIILHNGP